ncbi:MAG TPA: hypothetical protein VD971_07835 [Phycisphaerales bacterium]|nr:hypothetical protein [Phycisphaerales bacterium]
MNTPGKASKPKLKLAWWSAVPLAGITLIFGFASWQTSKSDDVLTRASGVLLMSVIMASPALFLSLLVYAASRRSALAFNITLCLATIGTLAAVPISRLARKTDAPGKVARVESERARIATEVVRTIEDRAARRAAGQALDEEADAERQALLLERAAQLEPAETAVYIRALAGFIREMGAVMGKTSDAAAALRNAGGIDPSTFGERADLAARMEMVAALRRSQSEAEEWLRTETDDLQERLLRAGVYPEEAARSAAELKLGLSGAFEMRRLQVKLCDAMTKYLKFLDDHWDDWDIDELGVIRFETPDFSVVHDQVRGEFDALAQMEADLLRRAAARRPE